jgi:striatin 1/3/4
MNRQKALISGHEDRIIRFCDINSGKIIKSIVAHSDAVTSLCIRSNENNELISISNDGSIRIWDIRKYKCINDIGIHMQKYD